MLQLQRQPNSHLLPPRHRHLQVGLDCYRSHTFDVKSQTAVDQVLTLQPKSESYTRKLLITFWKMLEDERRPAAAASSTSLALVDAAVFLDMWICHELDQWLQLRYAGTRMSKILCYAGGLKVSSGRLSLSNAFWRSRFFKSTVHCAPCRLKNLHCLVYCFWRYERLYRMVNGRTVHRCTACHMIIDCGCQELSSLKNNKPVNIEILTPVTGFTGCIFWS